MSLEREKFHSCNGTILKLQNVITRASHRKQTSKSVCSIVRRRGYRPASFAVKGTLSPEVQASGKRTSDWASDGASCGVSSGFVGHLNVITRLKDNNK